LGGLFVHRTGPRWIWGIAGGGLLVAALAGALLARDRGAESISEAEVAQVDPPHDDGTPWPGEDELRRLESALAGGLRAEGTEG
jgi:hypothetical protein